MNWLKKKLQGWLEITPSGKCVHTWEIAEKKEVIELFQMPAQPLGNFYLPNVDTNTYKRKKTQYVMRCKHCGEMKDVVL